MSGNNIYIKVYRSEFDKIECISIEEIVKMKVISNIDISFHIELLKVQAIVARTQVVRNARCFGGAGYESCNECDLCDIDNNIHIVDEEYLRKLWKENFEEYKDKLNRAIKETEGLIITINNKPIDAQYHNTCGGSTENSENVIGNEIVYLRRVLCEYCEDSPYWSNKKKFLLKDIEEKLSVKFPTAYYGLDTEIKSFIEDIERDENGRVTALKIAGKTFKGQDVMKLLQLNSTRFSISPEVISFNTGGKGHGLGICQYGANKMANTGCLYEDIINYYYTGVEIKKYNKPSIKKPLSGKIIVLDPAQGGENCNDSVGINGLREKKVVLEIAKKMCKELEECGADVFLTRSEDEYVSLGKRAKFGNDKRPDFFISLSLNSFPNPSIHGCEIYYYKGDKDSEALGSSIMDSLVSGVNVVNRGVKNADFFLLKEIKNSSLQIFLDYITNPEQEEKLSNVNYIDKISHFLVKGIVYYYRY